MEKTVRKAPGIWTGSSLLTGAEWTVSAANVLNVVAQYSFIDNKPIPLFHFGFVEKFL